MNSILILIALALSGVVASAKNEATVVTSCQLELTSHLQAEPNAFLPLKDLKSELAGRGRATLIVRMPLKHADIGHFDHDFWFTNSPGLSAPNGLRLFENNELTFVIDGGAMVLGMFGDRLMEALPNDRVGFQILESVVKDASEIHLTSPYSYTRINSAAPTSETDFQKLVDAIPTSPDRSIMVDDAGTKMQFDVFGAGAVQRILDSRALAKMAGIEVYVASSLDSFAKVLTRHQDQLKSDAPTAVRFRDVFLVNDAAAGELLDLKGKLAPAKPRASVHVSSELRSLLKGCLATSPRGMCLVPPPPRPKSVDAKAPEVVVPEVVTPEIPPVEPAPPVGKPGYPAPRMTETRFSRWAVPGFAKAEPPPETESPALSREAPAAIVETPTASVAPAVELPVQLTHDEVISSERLIALGKVRANIKPMMLIADQARELMSREENRVRAQISVLTDLIEAELTQLRGVEEYYREETDPAYREILVVDHQEHLNKIETYQLELNRLLSSSATMENDAIIMELSRHASASSELSDMENMYQNLARRRGWQFEEIDVSSDKLGLYHVILRISGQGVRQLMDTERGRHKFHHLHPKTEKEIAHYVNVSVYVEPSETETRFNENDFEIKTMRSSGAGGQHVNTTDSAVRVVHKATGIAAKVGLRRSQAMNKAMALAIVTGKLRDAEEQIQREKFQQERNEKSSLLTDGRWTRLYDLRKKHAPTQEILFKNGLDGILDKAQEIQIERRLHKLADSAPQM